MKNTMLNWTGVCHVGRQPVVQIALRRQGLGGFPLTGQIELVTDAKSVLGEGPHWDLVEDKLYWVDIDGRELRVYHPAAGSEDIHSFDQRVGAAVPD
ncbi:SMP-30/gluconolactonase/LRE family protein [Paenibacillus phytohabitans]